MKENLFKVASFLGAGILVLLSFIIIASGILLINLANPFNGIATIIGGVICLADAYLVYKNYQNVDLKGKPGITIKDVKQK